MKMVVKMIFAANLRILLATIILTTGFSIPDDKLHLDPNIGFKSCETIKNLNITTFQRYMFGEGCMKLQ